VLDCASVSYIFLLDFGIVLILLYYLVFILFIVDNSMYNFRSKVYNT
jgi:hypothetical protein